MFPNPQSALPLLARPTVAKYDRLANQLLAAGKSSTIKAWAQDLVMSFAPGNSIKAKRLRGRWGHGFPEYAKQSLAKPTLAAARYVIATSSGFSSWGTLIRHVAALADKSSPVAQFEAAVDAIVTGDLPRLRPLIRAVPTIVRRRSTREHKATLLHYTSANGIEGFRQYTPKNIVEIATLLLDAGSAVDATIHVYGGDCTTLGLAATSAHPDIAGVQIPLLQLLIDRGASFDRRNSAGNNQDIVQACVANGRARAAAFFVNLGAPAGIEALGAIGDLGRIKAYFSGDRRKRGVTKSEVERALLMACVYGHADVVAFLLEKGLDVAAHGGDRQTPSHMAVIGAEPEILRMLLLHKPPLEATNKYGGTVLGQAMWSAAHRDDDDIYVEIFELLLAAGARLPERHVPINPRLDAWLAARGSVPEPSWYWFGEGPDA